MEGGQGGNALVSKTSGSNPKQVRLLYPPLMKKVFFLIFLFFCLAGAFLFAKNATAQDYNFETIFYLPKYNATKGVASLEQNWKNIDILAPQYHTITANLKVAGSFGPQLKQAIKDLSAQAGHNLKYRLAV